MKTPLLYIGFFFAAFSAWSQPTITGIDPTFGSVGSSVTITGTIFSGPSVFFRDGSGNSSISATIQSSTATSITAVVPVGAFTGSIIVENSGGAVSAPSATFTVGPTITSFAPFFGQIGTPVTITGTNFSGVPVTNTVTFAGVAATISSSTTTTIETTVPGGISGGILTVSITVGSLTANKQFFVGTDNTAPGVSGNATPAIIDVDEDILVSAQFSDATSGIFSAEVKYRSISNGSCGGCFSNGVMTNTTGDTYTYTIPVSEIGELGIEYWYDVKNFAAVSTTPPSALNTTRINYPDLSGLNPPLPSGLLFTSYPGSASGNQVTNYRIISIPLVLDDKTVLGVFNDVLGGYNPAQWRMFKYNTTSLEFDELNDDSILKPGEGYWFISWPSTDKYTGPGTTVDVSTANPFKIRLQQGWNQIGNPYNFSISWADVIAANPTEASFLIGNDSKIRTFHGDEENLDVLEPLEGGFISFTGADNTDIVIPVLKNASINGRLSSTKKIQNPLDQPEWEILFDLKNGNTKYNMGGIGMHPEASEGFDYHDDFNSPRFIEYLEVKFSKSYARMTFTKDVVPTADNYVWQFAVESNLNDDQTTISWDTKYFGDEKMIYLIDLATLRIVNMSTTNHFDFNKSVSKNFKVVFGDAAFVKDELNPSRAVLFDPYPNPARSERVSIEYAMPESVQSTGAAIEIFNSMGQRISSETLPNQPGYGVWHWESKEQLAGTYFVKFKVGNQVLVKKLVKR